MARQSLFRSRYALCGIQKSLRIFGSYDLRQESHHWKNRMSREGILYTVAHLGVDLAKEILFVP